MVVEGPPTVYTRFSHTRFDEKILLQINYMAWFPERPRQGVVDLLGGALDAVIWRVTLGRDGRPLIYDTIHGCGCYHLFFPSARLPPLTPTHPMAISTAGSGISVTVALPARQTRATPITTAVISHPP